MLKDTEISEGILYLGRAAGREILEKLNNAKSSIRVITPYISSEFIDLLINKKHQNLDVRLIISSDIGSEKDKYSSLRKLISQKRHTNQKLEAKRKNGLKLLNYFLFILSIIIVLGFYYEYGETWYLLLGFPIVYFLRKHYVKLVIYSYTYESELSLSIPMSPYTYGFDSRHTLIHSKLFLIDSEVAYLGSVNFTKAAFWKNYESRIKLTQKEIIAKLEQEYNYIYDNRETYYLDISDTGRKIYTEPLN